jgi:DNA-binding PadR family transcriptional regulator
MTTDRILLVLSRYSALTGAEIFATLCGASGDRNCLDVALNRAAKQGLIQSALGAPGPYGRRARIYSLTPHGQARAEEIAKGLAPLLGEK